jgi:hypothetical protein
VQLIKYDTASKNDGYFFKSDLGFTFWVFIPLKLFANDTLVNVQYSV